MLLQVNVVVVVVALLRLFLSLIKSTNSKTCVSSKKEREKVKSFQIVEVKRIHTIFYFRFGRRRHTVCFVFEKMDTSLKTGMMRDSSFKMK